MSEFIQNKYGQSGLSLRLLATVSSATLLVAAIPAPADASSADRPTVWIELGGAFDQISAPDEVWTPPNLPPPISQPSPPAFGKLPAKGYDVDLKFTVAPERSDWIFSAGIRYGRASRGPKRTHDQATQYNVVSGVTGAGPITVLQLTTQAFTNSNQQGRSTHLTLDFQAGKDVGLGLFGGSAIVSAGVRVAKLNESAQGQMTGITNAPMKYSPGEIGHKAEFLANHSFNGFGPSASLDASTPLGRQSSGFTFDWGANAAILFGRQKKFVSLRTNDTRYLAKYHTIDLSHLTNDVANSRNAVVPNIGGFAGISWNLPSGKVSLGYRADAFFGAIDTGLDGHHSETRIFQGPYASISIGLGG